MWVYANAVSTKPRSLEQASLVLPADQTTLGSAAMLDLLLVRISPAMSALKGWDSAAYLPPQVWQKVSRPFKQLVIIKVSGVTTMTSSDRVGQFPLTLL